MQSLSLPSLPARSSILAIMGLFFFVGILVYGQSLRNEFVRWDDGLLIYENKAIREITPSSLKTIFTTYDPELYVPLTLLTYQLDFLVAGPRPQMYHFGNLVLHIANSLLVAWFCYLFLRKGSYGLLCGLVFLLHPLHTEAVAWSSARKDVLSTFFFLLSLITYYRQMEHENRNGYAVSLVTYLLGLLSKVTVVPLPVLLLLLQWKEQGRITKNDILRLLPYFVLALIFGIIATFGKTGQLSSVTPIAMIAMGGKSTVFYLQKLFWPTGLAVLYPYNSDIVFFSKDFLPSFIFLVALGIVALLTLKQTRTVVFCAGFFLLMLAPSLTNFAKGGTYYIASDRYAYIPSIGILLIAALTLQWAVQRFSIGKSMVFAFSLGLFCLLGSRAYAQSLTWENTETLFQNVLRHSPNSHVAYNNLGNIYRERGNIENAMKSYENALAIRMAYDLPSDDANDEEARMEFETNIANALATEGRLEEAITHYNSAISAESNSKILSNLAAAYRAKGDMKAAREKYTQALTLNHNNVQAMMGIGIVYQQQGEMAKAEESFLAAIKKAPLFSAAHVNLGALYVNTGRTEEGIASYDTAIEINPYFPQAYYNKGVALQKINRNREALDSYLEAVRLAPTFVAARINAGILLAERHKFDEAEEQFRQVLLSDPGNARADAALRQLSSLKR